MSEQAKFTPGPWLAAAKPSSVVGWPVVAPRATGRSICNVTVHDEAQANARLIAAAPELYAALKDTVRMLEAVRYTTGLGRNQLERIEKAKSILSKAEGRA